MMQPDFINTWITHLNYIYPENSLWGSWRLARVVRNDNLPGVYYYITRSMLSSCRGKPFYVECLYTGNSCNFDTDINPTDPEIIWYWCWGTYNSLKEFGSAETAALAMEEAQQQRKRLETDSAYTLEVKITELFIGNQVTLIDSPIQTGKIINKTYCEDTGTFFYLVDFPYYTRWVTYDELQQC